MKVTNIFVTSTPGYRDARDAADWINTHAQGSIGTIVFEPRDEAHIIAFLQAEIDSCAEDIREELTIEYEEIELEDE